MIQRLCKKITGHRCNKLEGWTDHVKERGWRMLKRIIVLMLIAILVLTSIGCEKATPQQEKATPQEEIDEFIKDTEIWHEILLDYVDILDDFYTDLMETKIDIALEHSIEAAITFAIMSYELAEYQDLIYMMEDTANKVFEELRILKEDCPKECEVYFSSVEQTFLLYEDFISILSNPDAFYESSLDKLNDIKADISVNANKVKIEREKLQ